MSWGRVAVVVSFGMLAVACKQAELPPCDAAAANELVFFDDPSDLTSDDGVPMTLGQALVHTSCGTGRFCHADAAESPLRESAPRGLDFDVAPLCTGDGCFVDPDSERRLREGMAKVRAHARAMYTEVLDRSMPPGRVGDVVVARAGVIRRLPPGSTELALGTIVPGLESSESRHALGNWLACGAPIVRAFQRPDTGHPPLTTCVASSEDGICVTKLPVAPEPLAAPGEVPRFQAIHDRVLVPMCASSCHGSVRPREAAPRLGTDCMQNHRVLLGLEGDEAFVDPTLPEQSHLFRHLAGDADHEIMPPALLTGRLPDDVIDAILRWIEAGAPATCD